MYRKKLALGKVDFSNGRDKAQENLTFGEFCRGYWDTARLRPQLIYMGIANQVQIERQ